MGKSQPVAFSFLAVVNCDFSAATISGRRFQSLVPNFATDGPLCEGDRWVESSLGVWWLIASNYWSAMLHCNGFFTGIDKATQAV
jgi:hypothetical protein